MGRIISGKPSRDTEHAAESLILSTLTSNTLMKKQETGLNKSITAVMQSSPPPDDNGEKKY